MKKLTCLSSVVYGVPHTQLRMATHWYGNIFNVKPNFNQSYYVGFRVNGFGLGLKPVEKMQERKHAPEVTTYWRLKNNTIEKQFQRLIKEGAKEFLPIKKVGDGITLGSLKDPFGNVVGLIENQHFQYHSSGQALKWIDLKNKSNKNDFLGLGTVVYGCENIEKAKNWYKSLLGVKPNFDQPFYVGFTTKNGFELGLKQVSEKLLFNEPKIATYWHVENISQSQNLLLNAGAQLYLPIEDVGQDVKVNTVKDPFGNIIGLIEDPMFKIKLGLNDKVEYTTHKNTEEDERKNLENKLETTLSK